MKEKYIEAGKIINTHGIRGEVKIESWLDSPEFLRKFKTIYISGAPVKVRSARVHNGFVIALLEGCGDVNAAMALKEKVICIDRSDAKLPKGTFFLADLMGASVVSDTGEVLGVLDEILERPAHNIYVVKGEREILIPDVPEFIRHVDGDAGVITVHLIEGM